MRADEIICQIIIPKVNDGSIIKLYKVSRRKDLDISTISAGFRLKLSRQNIIEDIMIVYGGMAEITRRAINTEMYLKGKEWNRINIEEAMKIINNDFSPISDVRADAGYRKLAARNILLKFWTESN